MEQQTTHTLANGSSRNKELCLLSLDGGGIRGISILHILNRVMEGIDRDNPPKPCEYFDMICGTSTGGLIALMLGRMKMSVDDCIKAYNDLTPSIFTQIRHRIKLSSGETQGRFDHEAMERGIKAILTERKMDTECLLKAPSEEDCKTFVCATSQETAETVVLSSYYNDRRGSDLLKVATVWEAVRATSAATTFFEPITIGDETFVDGATGANNPIQHLWTEAADMWGLQDNQLESNIKCLVSIGTGIPSLNAFGPSLKGVAQALKAIATETETTASLFRKHHTQLFQTGKAFRFNVIRGLESIGLEETAKRRAIIAATRKYLQTEEVWVEMKTCVTNLSERECLKSKAESILMQIGPHLSTLNDEKHHPSSDGLQWLTHTVAYTSWYSESQSGILWYQPNRLPDYASPQHVAASLAYRIASAENLKLKTETPSQAIDDARKSFSCPIYFQCDKPKNAQNISSNGYSQLEQRVEMETVLWTMIYQVLWSQCEDDVAAFQQRLNQFDREHKVMLLKREEGTGRVWSNVLFDLLVMALESSKIQGILAIDNVHLISHTQRGPFFEFLTSLAETCYFGMHCAIRVVITGGRLETITGLNPRLHVNNDTEREECLQSLYFPEWNLRRDQVADAEIGTNTWIWSHSQYEMWDDADSALLWIEGKPGSGKSVLAKTLQKTLAWSTTARCHESTERSANPCHDTETSSPTLGQRKRPKLETHNMAAYWFYHSRGGDVGMAHESLLRSILYQLLQQNENAFNAIVQVYRRYQPGKPLFDKFGHTSFDLLQRITETGQSITCIVDAMDEAKGLEPLNPRDVHRARTILSAIGNLLSKARNSKIKFIVLSRPDPAIELDYISIKRHCNNTFKVILEHEDKGDIHNIIGKGICSLQNALHAYDSEESDDNPSTNARKHKGLGTSRPNHLRSGEESSLEKIRSYLELNAGGVILWVTLILGRLENRAFNGMCTFEGLEQLMRTLPVHLNELYEYIMKELEVELRRSEELETARKVFILISGSAALNQPIRLRELWDALVVPVDIRTALGSAEGPIVDTHRVRISSWAALRRRLRKMCGPLIEVAMGDADHGENIHLLDSDIGPDDIVQFMHRSVKDFLHSPQKSGPLHFSEDEAIEEVRSIVKRYIEIAFPAEDTLYAPRVPAKEKSLWQNNIKDWANYLEEQILLRFCLSILDSSTNLSPKRLQDYASFDNLIYTGRMKEKGPLIEQERKLQVTEDEIVFFPECLDWVQLDWSEAVSAFALGHALYLACTRGLVIAARNMLDLFKWYHGHRKDAIWNSVISKAALFTCIEHGLLADFQTIIGNRHPWSSSNYYTNLVSPASSGYAIKSQQIQVLEPSAGYSTRGLWIDTFVEFAIRTGQEQIVEYLWDNSIEREVEADPKGSLGWQLFYARRKDIDEQNWDELFYYPGPGSLINEPSSEKPLANEELSDTSEVEFRTPASEHHSQGKPSPGCSSTRNPQPDFVSGGSFQHMSMALAGVGEWTGHIEYHDDFFSPNAKPDSLLHSIEVHQAGSWSSQNLRDNTRIDPYDIKLIKERCLRTAKENLQRRHLENRGNIPLVSSDTSSSIQDAVDLVMEVLKSRPNQARFLEL